VGLKASAFIAKYYDTETTSFDQEVDMFITDLNKPKKQDDSLKDGGEPDLVI